MPRGTMECDLLEEDAEENDVTYLVGGIITIIIANTN